MCRCGPCSGLGGVRPSGPLTITRDTTLTEDHHGSIAIAANAVTLDCAGHAVVGDGSAAVGIEAWICLGDDPPLSRSGFVWGLSLLRDTSVLLIGNTLTDNQSLGVRLALSTGGVVSGNVASGNGNTGFSLGGLQNFNVVGNRATGNQGSGIYFSTSSGVTFSGNTASDNTHFGLQGEYSRTTC